MVIREQYLDQIPEDSKSAISSANLLGTKFVNITKGSHPKHREPRRRNQNALPTQRISPRFWPRTPTCWIKYRKSSDAWTACLPLSKTDKGNIGKLIKDDSLYNQLN